MNERISPSHASFVRARRRVRQVVAYAARALLLTLCTSALGCSPGAAGPPAHEVKPSAATKLDGSLSSTTNRLDAGVPRQGQKGLDAGTDARTVDAAATPPDAAIGSSDAQSAKTDAAPEMDFCRQILPADPSNSGVVAGSVNILPAIPQHPSVYPRGPAVSAQFGTHVVWIFGQAVARGSVSDVVAVNSYTLSGFDHPYQLDEALPDAAAPLSFVPQEPGDLALGPDETLHYEIGSLVAVGPTELLLFYSPSKRQQGDPAVDTLLGTRVAHVKTDLKTIWAESEPELVFPGSAPSLRSGVLGRDGNVYLYGCRQQPSGQFDCVLARAPTGSATLARAYQYRAIGGWSNDLNVALSVLQNAGPELSVSYNAYLRRYLAIFFDARSNQIVLRTAERPEGPFTPLDLVTPRASSADAPVPLRNLLEHPELSSKCGKHLVLTYLSPTASGNDELTPMELELR